MFELFRTPASAFNCVPLVWAGGSGSRGERRSYLGTEAPGSRAAPAAEAGAVPGSPRGPPSCGVAPRSLPEVKECEQGSWRCSGTVCGAPDALPGRRCISRLREKSATSALPRQARAPRGSSGHVPGAAAGNLPAGVLHRLALTVVAAVSPVVGHGARPCSARGGCHSTVAPERSQGLL